MRAGAPCARPEPERAPRPAGSCPRSCRTGCPGPPAPREPRRRRRGHCPSPGPRRPGWPDSPCWRPGSAAGWPGPGGRRRCAAGPGWSACPGRSVTGRGRCAARPGPGVTCPGRYGQPGRPGSRACRRTPDSPGRRRASLDRTHSRRTGRCTAVALAAVAPGVAVPAGVASGRSAAAGWPARVGDWPGGVPPGGRVAAGGGRIAGRVRLGRAGVAVRRSGRPGRPNGPAAGRGCAWGSGRSGCRPRRPRPARSAGWSAGRHRPGPGQPRGLRAGTAPGQAVPGGGGPAAGRQPLRGAARPRPVGQARTPRVGVRAIRPPGRALTAARPPGAVGRLAAARAIRLGVRRWLGPGCGAPGRRGLGSGPGRFCRRGRRAGGAGLGTAGRGREGLVGGHSAQYCSSESLSHSVLGQSSSSSSCRPRDVRPRPLPWFFGRGLASVSGISARTRGNTSESARSGSALMRVAVESAEGPVS